MTVIAAARAFELRGQTCRSPTVLSPSDSMALVMVPWISLSSLPSNKISALLRRSPHAHRAIRKPPRVTAWAAEAIDATTIHRALVRCHDFSGSYSAVRRFIPSLPEHAPKAAVTPDFAACSAAQVDFGAGPKLIDLNTDGVVSSLVFVMTLCFFRHHYAEVVLNQRVDTWLACHRRVFEWFDGVPEKLIIDKAKCAITRGHHTHAGGCRHARRPMAILPSPPSL